ncbi:MAG TPA: metallophosphoesterase, partial [Magnetococcales bacterium]|nr:metallophosphoesterase [Magnetococcales bacterium]
MLTNPLHILHLADLHFGRKGRFSDTTPERLAKGLAAGVHKSLESADPHLVIVTGDFTDSSLRREYKPAREFLDCLASEFKLDTSRFLLLPGNHDCYRQKCESIKNQLIDEDEFSEGAFRVKIGTEKFVYYNEFYKSFMNNSPTALLADVHGALLSEFEDLGVAVATLNSNHAESHRDEDHHGELDPDKIKLVMDYWQGQDATKIPLRIVALHHNPTGKMETWLPQLSEQCRVSLVLHGHRHESNVGVIPWKETKGMTHVFAAGSMGAALSERGEDQPNSC